MLTVVFEKKRRRFFCLFHSFIQSFGFPLHSSTPTSAAHTRARNSGGINSAVNDPPRHLVKRASLRGHPVAADRGGAEGQGQPLTFSWLTVLRLHILQPAVESRTPRKHFQWEAATKGLTVPRRDFDEASSLLRMGEGKIRKRTDARGRDFVRGGESNYGANCHAADSLPRHFLPSAPPRHLQPRRRPSNSLRRASSITAQL